MPDAPSHWRLYSLVAFVTLLWSVNFVFAKFALREFPALLLSGVRTMVAAMLIVPVYLWCRRDVQFRWRPSGIVPLLMLGIVGVGLNQVLFVLGLSRTSAAHAGFIIGLTPIVVLIMAVSVGQEKLKGRQLAGMFMALSGVAAMQLGSEENRQASLLGDFLVFLGSLSFAVFTVRGKHATSRMSPIGLTTLAYVGSAMALLPVTLWAGREFQFSKVTAVGWGSVLYMAGISSVVAYLIYYHALKQIPASRVSTFSYVQPLLVSGLAIAVLGERPTPGLISGGALVLTGVFIAERA